MKKINMIGNTKIIICDDYIVTTEKERISNLRQIKKLIYEIYQKT